MADDLVAHMVIEEHVFYPRVKELMKDLVEESFEEHAVARFELARAMLVKGDDQKTRLTVLKELIEHHVEEEEKELFPKVLKAVPEQELEALGQRMELMFDKAVEAGLEKLVVATTRDLVTQNTRSASDVGTTGRRGGGRAKGVQARGAGARAHAR
jgi:hemerythrin superfamily protein